MFSSSGLEEVEELLNDAFTFSVAVERFLCDLSCFDFRSDGAEMYTRRVARVAAKIQECCPRPSPPFVLVSPLFFFTLASLSAFRLSLHRYFAL